MLAAQLTRTRSGRGSITASEVNEVVENENVSRKKEVGANFTEAFGGGGVVVAEQDSNGSILGDDLSLPPLSEAVTNEEDETVQSSVTGGSNGQEILHPTIFLATPTPDTVEEAMTIIKKLMADNEILRKKDKEHQDKVSIFCTEKI